MFQQCRVTSFCALQMTAEHASCIQSFNFTKCELLNVIEKASPYHHISFIFTPLVL